jgi:ABC-type xylose transport system substrate-binding protein
VIRAIIEVGKKKKGIGEQEMKDWSKLVGMGSWEKKL